jgi:hypothetical protein
MFRSSPRKAGSRAAERGPWIAAFAGMNGLPSMSLRSSPRKRGPSAWPWIPACAGMNGVLLRLLRPGSAASSLPREQLEPEAARREADRRRHCAIGKARNDHAAALAETAITFARNLLGGAHEQPRQDARHARARLQRGRRGTGTEHGHPHGEDQAFIDNALLKRIRSVWSSRSKTPLVPPH